MAEVRTQFHKQTGLNLWIIADLHLQDIPTDNFSALAQINKDLSAYRQIKKEVNKRDRASYRSSLNRLNHMGYLHFYNDLFYPLEFTVKDSTIELLYGIGRFYFPISLNKVLYDLGGQFIRVNETATTVWEPPRSWRRLRPWHEYKWYNRPRR